MVIYTSFGRRTVRRMEKKCDMCGIPNHFARQGLHSQRSGRILELDEFDEEAVYNLEAYTVHPVSVTLKLINSGNFMTTRAECNVIPVHVYKQATGDVMMGNVKPSDNRIVAFGGTKLSLRAQVMLPMSRGKTRCTLRCKIVEADVRPLLGRKVCTCMKLFKVLDSDGINRPVTGDRPVFAVRDADDPLTKEQLVSRFPNVFADSIGKLDGNYHIRLDPGVDPVQHAPRRVSVALRSKLQTTLNRTFWLQ